MWMSLRNIDIVNFSIYLPLSLVQAEQAKPSKPLPADAYVRNREYDDLEDDINELSLETSHHHPELMEVVQNYFPCSALELPVRQGEIVEYIQSEGLWMYVRTENGADGYIPRRHCRLLDASELSDLGYYSDQYRNEDQDLSRVGSTSNLQKSHHNKSFDRHQTKTTPILRVSKVRERLSFSSTDSSHSSSSQHYLSSERVMDGKNGLYTKGRSGSNLHFDTTPRPSRRHTANDDKPSVAPVCGRKCGDNCEHKLATRKSRADSHLSTREHKVKNPSIVSESSGKSVSFKDSHIIADENNSNNNNNITDQIDSGKASNRFELPQTKCGHPELIIIQKYEKKNETDISVNRGDYAAIVNDTKYENWMYIVNEAGQRGFIPHKCAIKHECHDCQISDPANEQKSENGSVPKPSLQNEDENEETMMALYTSDDLEAMKQLVVTRDYSGKSLNDLYVCVGDIVYMSADEQAGDSWLWVHSLRLNSSGYIPVGVVKDMALIQKATV